MGGDGGVTGENDSDGNEGTHLDPVEAFTLLAHDTRMAALRVLWEAGEPLRFSEIADRANISDTGNFNYHLGELVGSFVREAGEAYSLTRSGRQAMTAVLAGDVTERPTLEPIRIDSPCPYCGADIELAHGEDDLRVLCSSCEGTFRGERSEQATKRPNPHGTITTLPFPPAGLHDRRPRGVLDAALTRFVSRSQQQSTGVCPDCAGPVESTTVVCPDHDGSGICTTCGSRFAGQCTFRCRTCGTVRSGLAALQAVAEPAFIRFFLDHGLDFLDPTWREVVAALDIEERVHRIEPLEYEAVWVLDDTSLSMYLDDQRGTVQMMRDARS